MNRALGRLATVVCAAVLLGIVCVLLIVAVWAVYVFRP